MKLLNAIPAMPVTDIEKSAAFYRDKLGFALGFHNEGFAKLVRECVEIHLWAARDEEWRERRDFTRPIISGAESFIAGTASCRIGVEGVDELYREIEPRGVLHTKGAIRDTDFGTREFHVSDPDNNLVTFFERLK
jgi:catechol 2,3-dioxygenase-like lactoylglutathione lyase family enzyme